jgi:hypothetical protein
MGVSRTGGNGTSSQQGFEFCGFSEAIDHYPSAALFQKATEHISAPERGLFRLSRPDGG